MPELGYKPVNKYLPPRRQRMAPNPPPITVAPADDGSPAEGRLLRWVDRLLSR
jgi:sulfite dehydrogenase (quinone) subunit SoeB